MIKPTFNNDYETDALVKLEIKKELGKSNNQDSSEKVITILDVLMIVLVILPWLYFLSGLAVLLVSTPITVLNNTANLVLKSVEFLQIPWLGVPLLLSVTFGVTIICTIKPIIRGIFECSIAFVGCCYAIFTLIPSVGGLAVQAQINSEITQVSALAALITSGIIGSSGASLILNEKQKLQ